MFQRNTNLLNGDSKIATGNFIISKIYFAQYHNPYLPQKDFKMFLESPIVFKHQSLLYLFDISPYQTLLLDVLPNGFLIISQ